MFTYILRRLALIVPTLFGILLLNFVIIQFAPGGPVEQVLAELQGQAAGATARVSGGGGDVASPLRGLTSDNFDEMTRLEQIGDYFWHLVLPVTSMVIGGFAGLTLLTKNAFLDQIRLQYVETARAKGLNERQVLYGHVFLAGAGDAIGG